MDYFSSSDRVLPYILLEFKGFFLLKKETERERVIICNNYFFVQRTLLGKKKVEMFL